MRQVARECWRVLRDDGVMFWNIADSYNSNASNQQDGKNVDRPSHEGAYRSQGRRNKQIDALKPKDKCGIPERTALAFQADGWYWRSGITWVKPNPMPESVTDRPTKSTEMVYLFAKQERYYWDSEAVREEAPTRTVFKPAGWNQAIGRHDTFDGRYESDGTTATISGRNLRDAWTIATAPYPGQHFATFPPELPRRCIKAGTSERGACPKCGKAWVRVSETKLVPTKKASWNFIVDDRDFTADRNDQGSNRAKDGHKSGWINNTTTIGWRAACSCDAGDPVPCIVLDPFSGAATTGIVARELGRHYVGLELSAEYLQQSRDRLSLTALDEWTNGSGNGKAHGLDDLPMFKGIA